jgi:hypothetical protein
VPERSAAPESSVAFDAEASRPLLANVNRGRVDLVVRSATRDGYVAIDGDDGKELWRTSAARHTDPSALAWIAGNRLLSLGSAGLNVFDLSTGSLVRYVELESDAQLACEATPGKARVMVADGAVVAIDVESGAIEREEQGATCKEIRTDLRGAREAVPDKARVVRVMPAGVPTVRCPGESSDSADSSSREDPCSKARSSEIVPNMLLATDLGDVVLGRKRTGKPLPAIALVKDNKLAWTVFPAVDKDSPLDKVALDHGEIAVLYDDTTGTRLLSWDIATGRPALDIVLSRRAKWIDGDGEDWIVTGTSVAFRVDRSGGALRPIAGGLAAAEPEWNPGWPVPRGYTTHTRATPDGKEMAIGGGLFAGMMIANVIIYFHLDDPPRLWPILIPAVGPFINIGTIRPNFGDVTGLIFDGATQAVGIVLFSVGAAQKTTTLVPAVRPTVGLGTLGIQGTF